MILNGMLRSKSKDVHARPARSWEGPIFTICGTRHLSPCSPDFHICKTTS